MGKVNCLGCDIGLAIANGVHVWPGTGEKFNRCKKGLHNNATESTVRQMSAAERHEGTGQKHGNRGTRRGNLRTTAADSGGNSAA